MRAVGGAPASMDALKAQGVSPCPLASTWSARTPWRSALLHRPAKPVADLREIGQACETWERSMGIFGASESARSVRGRCAPEVGSVSRRQIGDDLNRPNSRR